VRLSRALARNDQQYIGNLDSQARKHMNQEIDIFLVRYTTDEKRHWAPRI